MKKSIEALSEISEKHIDELKDIGNVTPIRRRAYRTVIIAATLSVMIFGILLFAIVGSNPPSPPDNIPQSSDNEFSCGFVSDNTSSNESVHFKDWSQSNQSLASDEESTMQDSSFVIEDSSEPNDSSIYVESSGDDDPSQSLSGVELPNYNENGAAFTAQQMADVLRSPKSDGITTNYETFYFDNVSDIQVGDLPNGKLPVLLEDDWDYVYDQGGLGGKIEYSLEIDGETIVIPSDSTIEDVYSAAESFLPVCQKQFGFDYSDILVIESKTSHCFYVYYFDAALDIPYFEYGHPIRYTNSMCYLRIDSNVGGSEIYTLCGISYKAENGSIKEGDSYEAITLEEAELLLNSGYVFGGHGCPLCMQMNLPVDFSDYDLVGIEYVSGYDSDWNPTNVHYPFYAFYKEIYEGKFARTYVPAFRVNGLDEYFESQKNMHK